MVLLHIASIRKEALAGVAVAVPQHVRVQQNAAVVGFINVTGDRIDGIEHQLHFGEDFSFSDLPNPFCAPDLIVFHEVYYPAFLKLYQKAKAAGIPYIIVPHGCLTRQAQKKKALKKWAGNLLLFGRFINGAAAIQFLSEQERDNSAFGEKKIIGTNGVFMPQEKKTQFSEETVKLLYIGRTEVHIKGLDLLLQAVGDSAGLLRERKVRLSLYGPDLGTGHAEILELINRFNISDLVELNGAVIGERKKEELLGADLFVQTSRSEGMPMGILEALSYGLPCLVTEGTNLGGIIDRYDAGWVTRADASSIAQTLLTALEKRERWEEKSRNSVRLVEENFQWDRVVQETLDHYRRIVGK